MTQPNERSQESMEALGRVFKQQPSVSRAVMASIKTKKAIPLIPSKLNNIWRLIMKKQSRQFAIAAMALFLVGLTVWQLGGSIDGTGRVYAMSEVPDLFRSARTLHMKVQIYYPNGEGSEELSPMEAEFWLDFEKQRWRSINPVWITDRKNGVTFTTNEEVYDTGDFVLRLDRGNQTATYERITPYRRARRLRQGLDMLLQFSFGDPRLFDQYQPAGQEQIQGEQYDVWQLDINQNGIIMGRLRSWFSPQTGEIFKSEVSFKQNESGPWIKQIEVNLIERNVPIDDRIFVQTVPQGYTEDTIDTTLQSGMHGSSGSLKLWVYLLIQLGDGSVIGCWKSQDTESDEDPVRLLEGISAGAKYPEFPVVFSGLSRGASENEYTYHGHYLAHTVHGSDLYLWGLYVPKEIETPAPGVVPGQYTILHRTNVSGKDFRVRLSMSADVVVENQSDFDTFILGAMADFSDPGAELPSLTYAGTLELAEQIRSGLHR